MKKNFSSCFIWLFAVVFLSLAVVIPSHRVCAETSTEVEEVQEQNLDTSLDDGNSSPTEEEVVDYGSEIQEQVEDSDSEFGWE